jgi:Peptidase family S51
LRPDPILRSLAGRYGALVQTVILGSDRFDCLLALLNRDPAAVPAAYVPTAADVLDDQAYVQDEMSRLAGMGFPVSALLLAGASQEQVTAALRPARLLFVTGGNAFHLLHHAKVTGFTEAVPPLVRSGALIYVGISAGAHLATPDLLPCVSKDTRWKAPALASTAANGTRAVLGAPPPRRPGTSGTAQPTAGGTAAASDRPDHR